MTPFKVMCIDARPHEIFGKPPLMEGFYYTVVDSYTQGKITGWVLLGIDGFRFSEGCCTNNTFNPRRFVLLSEIDETEMIREYNTEKV